MGLGRFACMGKMMMGKKGEQRRQRWRGDGMLLVTGRGTFLVAQSVV